MRARLAMLVAVPIVFGWTGNLDLLAQQSAREALLITPQQLSRVLRDPNTVVLHVGPRDDYQAGHIEGARFIEQRDVSVSPEVNGKRLALELPGDADLRERLERFGINDQSRIVVAFGKDWGSPATRVVWTLQVAGFGDRTQLLNGGTEAWRRAGLPLVTTVPTVTPGKLTRTVDRSLVVDHQWMQANVGAQRVRLVDGRTPMFFEGPPVKENGGERPVGHLRGAVNLPFNTMVDDSLHFLPTEMLRKAFAAVGIQPGDTIAAYCHIGQQATTVLFAARLLGHPIRLYDGSMNDWENRALPLVNEKTKASSNGGGSKESRQ